MYKVFYNERIVFFVESNESITENKETKIHFFKDKKHLKSTLDKFLSKSDFINLYVVCENTEFVFKEFTKLYKTIEAAGGLVKNSKNELLFIYRRNKWDLPKGKLEKKEDPKDGALREVEEECGISNLQIINLLEVSYHTYNLSKKNILKRTYWFEMFYNGNDVPKPQLEEEITEAKWLKIDELEMVSQNTFPSIIEVLRKAEITI